MMLLSCCESESVCSHSDSEDSADCQDILQAAQDSSVGSHVNTANIPREVDIILLTQLNCITNCILTTDQISFKLNWIIG